MEIKFKIHTGLNNRYGWWVETWATPDDNFNNAINNHINHLEETVEKFKDYRNEYSHRKIGLTVAQVMQPYLPNESFED